LSDSHPTSTNERDPPPGAATPSDLVFGIERSGLLGLRVPLLSIIVVVALAIAAGFGVSRIEVDDSLNQLFRSETPQFKQYEEVTRRFPSSEYGVLVVVQGNGPLSRNSIEHLRDLVTDLQLIERARGIISLFSARQPSLDGGLPGPLFPNELPQEVEYDKLAEEIRSNEIIRDELLSQDGTLALVMLSLNPDAVGGGKLNKVVEDILKSMADDLADSTFPKGSSLYAPENPLRHCRGSFAS
jgi:uncharacterized protein